MAGFNPRRARFGPTLVSRKQQRPSICTSAGRRTNIVGKNTAVFGIYKTRASAEKAVDNLISAGSPSGDVSVLLPDIESSKNLAHEKNTKAPEGTTTGVAAGGAAGGALGLLVGTRSPGDPGSGTIPRSRANRGCAGGIRGRRSGRRHGWSAGRYGHTIVRSQALRRPCQVRRHPVRQYRFS